MGCSSSFAVPIINEEDTLSEIDILTGNQTKPWLYYQNKILNQFTSFMIENNYSNNFKIGFYERITYTKLKSSERYFTYVSRKIFLKYNSTKHKNEIKSFINEYFNRNKKYQKYYSMNEDITHFTIEKVMNLNCTDLNFNFKQKEIALCFVKFQTLSCKEMISIINIWKLKNQQVLFIVLGNCENSVYENNLHLQQYQNEINAFIKSTKVKVITDQGLLLKYNVFNKYTIFLNESKVHSWIETIYWNGNVPKLAKSNDNNSISLYKQTIKNMINSKQIFDEYEIIYQKYELFTSANTQGKVIIFPIFEYGNNKANRNEHNQQIQILFKEMLPKLDINTIIIQSIQNIVGNDVNIALEVFKERKYSIIFHKVITIKKQYTIILNVTSHMQFNILTQTKQFIINKLNPFLNLENPINSIIHLVLKPSLSMNKDSYLSTNNKGILIFRDSNCLNYINETLIKSYIEHFSKKIDTFIISETSSIQNEDTYSDNNIIYINNSSKINNSNEKISTYFYTFCPEAYNAHLFIMQNQGKITFCDFFRNSNCVYFNHINNSNKNESFSPLKYIKSNEFANTIKGTFASVINKYKDNISSLCDNISYNKIFSVFRTKLIYDQPYISLKYNKILQNNKENKQYKNYSVNFITTSHLENPLDEFPKLNEISKVFYGTDSYFSFNKERVKCQECNVIIYGRVTNKDGVIPSTLFSLYLCPVTKSTFCVDCVNKEMIINNVYNLLYVQASNKMIMNAISQNNVENFKCIEESKMFEEIKENECDVCKKNVMNGSDSKSCFYSLMNVINRNLPCLVCNCCFEIITDYRRQFEIEVEYEYIKKFIQINFVDLDNLIFKKIIV